MGIPARQLRSATRLAAIAAILGTACARKPDVEIALDQPATGDEYLESPLLQGSRALSVHSTSTFGDGVKEVIAVDLPGRRIQSRFNLPAKPNALGDTALEGGLLLVVTECPGMDTYQCSVLHALDPETGAERWSYRLPKRAQGAATVGAGGLVFIGCDDAFLYALDAAKGRLRWKFKAKDAVASKPRAADDAVYFTGSERALYALDARTGRLRWRTPMSVTATDPLLLDGVAYVADSLGDFHAFDAKDGRLLWKIRLSNTSIGFGSASPLIAGKGVVYAASDGVYAVDVQARKELWRTETEGLVKGALVLQDGKIFALGIHSMPGLASLHDIDAKTGFSVWRFSLPGGAGVSPMAGGDGLVYFIGYAAASDRYSLYGFRP